MAADKKTKFRLTHHCHKEGCVGVPGDVITVSAEDAQFLLERAGGFLCDEKGNALPAAEEKPAPAK
jgi:hypothetical protein